MHIDVSVRAQELRDSPKIQPYHFPKSDVTLLILTCFPTSSERGVEKVAHSIQGERNAKSARTAMFAFVIVPMIFLSSSIVWSTGGLTAADAATTPKKMTTCTNIGTGAIRILLKGTCNAKTEEKINWIELQSRPSSTPSPAALKCALGGSCKVGDLGPGGGVVFYVADSKQSWGKYLEAGPNSWEGGYADPAIMWCTHKSLKIVGQPSVGSGSSNTSASIAECPYGAAERARAYRGGGKSDWFLPSRDELHQLYLNRLKVGGFSGEFYWSSSNVGSSGNYGDFFWSQNIGTGQGGFHEVYRTMLVRPVRAF